MLEIAAAEAEGRLSALLERVEQGEEVVITRKGRPIARLVAESAGVDREKARQAAAGLRAARKGVTLDGLSLRDLIKAGQR